MIHAPLYFYFKEDNIMTESNRKEIEEIKELCSKVFICWGLDKHTDPTKHNMELLNDMFTPRVLLKKFEAFDINIVLPDNLLVIIAICCNENPGQAQLILKELLLSIRHRKGLIPDGYVITSEDFGLAFPFSFPIMADENINKEYYKKWDAQKFEKDGHLLNLCDTIGWWKEVME